MKHYYRKLKKNILLITGLMLLSAITHTELKAQVVAGVDTLSKISGTWQYYDFTSQKAFSIEDTATYTPDFWGSSNEGVNFGKEFSSLIPGKRVLLLGSGNIDTVTTVPTWTDAAPWVDTSWDFTNGTQGQPISPGQLWVVYTSEGLYAVMQIDALPGGNFGNSFVFKYKYMSEGGTTLDETNLNSSDQLVGSATSSSGNGFDLSGEISGELEDAGDYLPDFVFVNNEGVNFGNEGSTSLSSTGRRFMLLGTGNLDTLKSVPARTDAAPWVSVSYDFSDGTGGQPIAVGQLWGIYTREGKYAAIEITALPGGNFGSSFDFNYKYQPDGSRFFEESEFQDPDPVLSIAIESGNNQTADLSSQPANPIVVLITDQDGAVVSGETVNFEITNDPIGVNEEGTVTPSDVSDASGLAEATVTVGDKEGIYTIKASLASDDTKFVEFTITAEEEVTGPQPTTLVITGGQNQVTVLGDTIATSLEVVVIDDIGEPMNGITVTFEEETIPNGAVSGSFFTPDGINVNQATTFNNRAYMDYSLGDKQGDYLIKAYLANYPAVDSVVFTISGELVKAPMNFTANAQSGVIDLMWDVAEGAKEYNIYRALNDDNPASASLLATISGNVSTDDNVTPGETYFYRVFSVDAFGNESELGAGPISATPEVVGDVVMGTATIIKDEGAWQFFDFSTQSVSNQEENGGFVADFRGTSNEGVNFGREGAPSISGNRIILLSEENLESVSEIPSWTNEEPWIGTTWDFSNGTGGQPISVGQLWGVYTSEGHYAAMEITEVPEAFGTSFSFSYKYQPSGSNQFEEVEPLIPSALLKVSGDEQIGNPEKALAQPLMVQVVDENETPVEGISVNFAVTKLPEAAMSWGLSANSVITNSEGQARVILTLGDKLGEYEVTASVDELESVVFSSSAVEIPAPDAVTLLEVRDGFRANSLMPLWTQSNSENFLRYRIYMSTEGGELMLVDSTRTGNLFTQDTAKTINDLTALQDYSFAVTVVNADLQESELSNTLTNFPKPVPDQPKDVVATAGDRAVQLSWAANDSAYFDYYYVYSGLDGFGVFANDTLYGYNNTSLVISGLENDQTYQFYVIAVNRFGQESSFPEKITAIPASTYEEEETTLPNLINGISSWADTDNDGDLDLLITGQEGDDEDPQTLLLTNDGTGELTNSDQTFEGVANSTVFWFDIDQNGYVDLVLSGESATGPVTKVYLNNEGTFTDSGFSLPGFEDGIVSPADYDSDGDIDFLAAGTVDGNPQTLLIKNMGSGIFEPVAFGFAGFSMPAASWGDANADGKPDLFITGADSDGNIDAILYMNLGNDSFVASESVFQGVINGTVAFTDFDLDTDQDVLITGYTDVAETNLFTGFYENTGTGFDLFYSTNSNQSDKRKVGGLSKSRAVVGDYDNDGDPDVLISAEGEATIFNNNRGDINEEKLNVSGAGSVTWVDYDGDGDLDIVISGASSKVLSNNTSIKNTAPSVPEGLMFSTAGDTVNLIWNASLDAQTPTKSLTYNVRIGTSHGASDVLSANSDLSTGKLRTQANGNAGYKTSLSLRGLPNGTYYWQVQAVDNGFMGSMFSQEQQFDVTLSTVSNETEQAIPLTTELAQNYPNPFNPSTTINYTLKNAGPVNIRVYNVTGRLVQELVNDRKSAGEHVVSFDASNLASGIYIYRLQAEGKVLIRKMTLIK